MKRPKHFHRKHDFPEPVSATCTRCDGNIVELGETYWPGYDGEPDWGWQPDWMCPGCGNYVTGNEDVLLDGEEP